MPGRFRPACRRYLSVCSRMWRRLNRLPPLRFGAEGYLRPRQDARQERRWSIIVADQIGGRMQPKFVEEPAFVSADGLDAQIEFGGYFAGVFASRKCQHRSEEHTS